MNQTRNNPINKALSMISKRRLLFLIGSQEKKP